MKVIAVIPARYSSTRFPREAAGPPSSENPWSSGSGNAPWAFQAYPAFWWPPTMTESRRRLAGSAARPS